MWEGCDILQRLVSGGCSVRATGWRCAQSCLERAPEPVQRPGGGRPPGGSAGQPSGWSGGETADEAVQRGTQWRSDLWATVRSLSFSEGNGSDGRALSRGYGALQNEEGRGRDGRGSRNRSKLGQGKKDGQRPKSGKTGTMKKRET